MRHSRSLIPGLLLAALLAPAGLRAQAFEGTVRQRTITLHDAAVERLLYGDDEEPTEENVPDDESEEAYLRRLALRAFAVPMERLLLIAREEDGEVEEVTISVKGDRIRSDFANPEGGSGFVMVDLANGVVTMVNADGRYYVQWTREELDAQLEAMGLPPDDGDREPGPALTARALGRSLTVAGSRCTGVEIELPGEGLVWGWVAEDQPALRQAVRSLGERAGAMLGGDEEDGGPDADDLLIEHGFPMRVQRFTGAAGFPVYEVEEVLSVERGPVAASLFEIPAGFAKKTLKEVWGG